jgi:hypothetical protein
VPAANCWSNLAVGADDGTVKIDGSGCALRQPAAAMPLFWKPYTSDVTAFLQRMKAERPTLEEEQRAGRALLWEKRIDREAQTENMESRIPQQPYVYQTRTP